MSERLDALLRRGTQHLTEAGIAGAPRDARLLLAGAAGLRPDRLSLELGQAASEAVTGTFMAHIERRIAREPVSRILGHRLFWGRSFRVTPDVLDPRPETESLIAAALEGGAATRLLDLGTGSGIIAATLLAEWPDATGLATDVSAAALAVARENAASLGLAGRLDFVEADWWQGVAGRFDLIASNPPYITEAEMAELSPEVAKFDPTGALTPGGDGLAPYRIIAAGALSHLTPGGRLMVEIGWRQGPDVAALFTDAGLMDVAVLPDMDGRDRVVTGRASA
ncbi:peptide chain release factor N(5)-glutamine methyltransferase [Pseudooceanicola nanhaiensis]|uniref:peptide chain release factor N(5)-glutamine methyltransferase n=1 Tax=Pseudooceanicola nanhaiensis TaxID=375761 RepID=UPI001CD58711|nr:peptide chain release factor N(5)-glutamine methyltransferase [Pseudooceanicola nanhaiensis]MCA0920932.1 peptide chain release factor N(5)-glutamine methyltransferase [Pseudooceanicola nanhaiensis]